MAIRPSLLIYELQQAGLPVSSVSSMGQVDYSRTLTADEASTATRIISNHNPDGLLPWEQAMKDSQSGYVTLPDWAKAGTAVDAETYIKSQIFNGQSIAQATTYINSMIPNVSGSNVAALTASTNTALAGVRTVFITAATAIINMRELFILTAKLLIYIRDLVIRFRTP